MRSGRCEICGKEFPRSENWFSTRFCSTECRNKQIRIKKHNYFVKNREKLNEQRRINIQRKEEEKNKKHEDTMAEINEMARERGLTYGQMQGVIWCREHPQIIKPKGWGKV